MSEIPTFFVPLAQPAEYEELFMELARFAGHPVPELAQRIYSITFIHDGEEWTATVGERLRGHTIANPRARAKNRRVSRPASDSATVEAIFAGNSYIVVTDSRLAPRIQSRWGNPFMAGRPGSVTYFGAKRAE